MSSNNQIPVFIPHFTEILAAQNEIYEYVASEIGLGFGSDSGSGSSARENAPASSAVLPVVWNQNPSTDNSSSNTDSSDESGSYYKETSPDAMSPAALIDESVTTDKHRFKDVGPHPSFIQVAKPYQFEQKIQACLKATGNDEAKEDAARLQGVTWIDGVRKAMQLPVKTFNVACCYYHKFRLVHAESEYNFIDAAAAALFSACKIEDTLKKSRDILCAAYNLKVSLSDQLSPDDSMFEEASKRLVGLERLMLESAGFDFRSRYPQEFLMKILKTCQYDRNTIGITAYNMCIDIYRTFAPLKQTTSTMAIACVELAIRLYDADMGPLDSLLGDEATLARNYGTDRAQIMETLLDLLDLYTHHRASTTVGPEHAIDTFIQLRIALNKVATAADLPRFTEFVAPKKLPTNGASTTNGKTASPHSPASNGAKKTTGSTAASPESPLAMGPVAPATGSRSRVGLAGKDGTVRFMLDAERERHEIEVVEGYLKEEWEEYEEVIERPARDSRPPPTAPSAPRRREGSRERERDRDRDRERERDRDSDWHRDRNGSGRYEGGRDGRDERRRGDRDDRRDDRDRRHYDRR